MSPVRATRIRKRLRDRFVSDIEGAIDLASIMVGVIVIGIIAGVISATVFAVIPWSQDQATQASLKAVQTAQGVAYAKDGSYESTSDLVANGYLPASATGLTASAADTGSNAHLTAATTTPGVQLAAAHIQTDAAAAPGTIATAAAVRMNLGTSNNCYVASATSASGNTFYITNQNPKVAQVTTTVPDTTSCAAFPQPNIGAATIAVYPSGAGSQSAIMYNGNLSGSAGNTQTTLGVSDAIIGSCPTGTTMDVQNQQNDGTGWANITDNPYHAAGSYNYSNVHYYPTNAAVASLPTSLQLRAMVTCQSTTGPWNVTAYSPVWTQGIADGLGLVATPPTWTHSQNTSAHTEDVSITSIPACPAGQTTAASVAYMQVNNVKVATLSAAGAFPTLDGTKNPGSVAVSVGVTCQTVSSDGTVTSRSQYNWSGQLPYSS